MKARELMDILKEYPDADVTVTIEVDTDDDSDRYVEYDLSEATSINKYETYIDFLFELAHVSILSKRSD